MQIEYSQMQIEYSQLQRYKKLFAKKATKCDYFTRIH